MNVLMVTWDAGGNIPPFLGLGRELLRRGHGVRCLGPQGVQAAVARTGLAFRPLEHSAGFDPLAPLPLDQSQQAQAHVFFGDGYPADLRAEVEQDRPDVVVIDCFLVAAQGAAEAMGLPFVLLVHTLPGWFMPFWDQVLLSPTNALRERTGLSPVASTAELLARADRALVACTPLLDSPVPDSARLPWLRYVGPIFEPEDQEELEAAAVPQTAEPLVLVGFSTTYMDQEKPLACVIDALRSLPVRAIITTGPAVDLALLPAAPNVTVHQWLPHAAVLPQAALVVTHAGHSTVTKALSYGVPLLCLPLGRDQGFIAQRVQDIGAGLAVPSDAAPDELAAAITSILGDHSYREAAQQAAAIVRVAGPGARNAAAELETIAA